MEVRGDPKLHRLPVQIVTRGVYPFNYWYVPGRDTQHEVAITPTSSIHRSSLLLHGLSVLYCTHSLLECMNIGVVLLVSILAMHAMVLCSRAMYGANLYVELV